VQRFIRIIVATAVGAALSVPVTALAGDGPSGTGGGHQSGGGVTPGTGGGGSTSWGGSATQCGKDPSDPTGKRYGVLLGWDDSAYGMRGLADKPAVANAVTSDPALLLPLNSGTLKNTSVLRNGDSRYWGINQHWQGCFYGDVFSDSVAITVPAHLDPGTIKLSQDGSDPQKDLVVQRVVTGSVVNDSGQDDLTNTGDEHTINQGPYAASIRWVNPSPVTWHWDDGSSDHTSPHTYHQVAGSGGVPHAGVTITASRTWNPECRSFDGTSWTPWAQSNCQNVQNGGVYTQNFTDPQAPRPIIQVESVPQAPPAG
jgi:hypothetical protein